MIENNSKSLLLFSGGIDSTVCLKLLKDRELGFSILFIDYGQVSAKNELRSVEKLSTYYKVGFKKIDVKTERIFSNDEIRGRNAFLIITALMYSDFQSGTIVLGIHKGTGYKDCSSKFVREIQKTIDLYCDGEIRVDAPLLKFTKDEIWRIATERNIPVDQTYSCELGLKQPCRKCKSCQDLEKLYEL